jgi:lipopolysaccharide/colanic/teichoic acid biosynthesis glycosyltransferase
LGNGEAGTCCHESRYRHLKRAVDIILAVSLLLITAPLILAIAAAVAIESRGPITFTATRIGYGGRPLRMLKFRKMRADAVGPALTSLRDARFTRLGPLLTSTKFDELPQLWNVLRGEMSLVGPRPESPEFVDRFHEDYSDILRVMPGMIGLSQIAFAEESRILGDSAPVERYLHVILPQKLALDRLYAERQSLSLDLRILFWGFVVVVLRRPVAVDRRTGRMRLRRRCAEQPAAAVAERGEGECHGAL